MHCFNSSVIIRLLFASYISVVRMWRFLLWIETDKSSRSQLFFKISVLKSFVNFTEKYLYWSLFIIKLRVFKRFLVKSAKFLRTPFLKEYLRLLLLNPKSILYHDCLSRYIICKERSYNSLLLLLLAWLSLNLYLQKNNNWIISKKAFIRISLFEIFICGVILAGTWFFPSFFT